MTTLQKYLLVIITLAIPMLLTIGSIRLVMSEAFLNLEYNRSGFPEDDFGFTTQDRLTYAPYAVNYLLNGADIDYLSSLQFLDGKSLYTVPELRHMRDVKAVTQYAYFLAAIVATLALLAAFTLWRNVLTRSFLRRALLYSSVLTLALIAVIVIASVVAWDFFFTLFHTLFFQSGTWRFAYSDTLIRLFPEQFWFDAALTIGGMTTFGALMIGAAAWFWGKKSAIVKSADF